MKAKIFSDMVEGAKSRLEGVFLIDVEWSTGGMDVPVMLRAINVANPDIDHRIAITSGDRTGQGCALEALRAVTGQDAVFISKPSEVKKINRCFLFIGF